MSVVEKCSAKEKKFVVIGSGETTTANKSAKSASHCRRSLRSAHKPCPRDASGTSVLNQRRRQSPGRLASRYPYSPFTVSSAYLHTTCPVSQAPKLTFWLGLFLYLYLPIWTNDYLLYKYLNSMFLPMINYLYSECFHYMISMFCYIDDCYRLLYNSYNIYLRFRFYFLLV